MPRRKSLRDIRRPHFSRARDHKEVQDYFSEMYSLLRDECKKYDEGDSRYILNIVGKLYILLDDSGSQKSVLRQLGVRNKIMFPDSCSLHDKRSILPPLVDVHVSPLASERLIFAAKLNACHAAERVVYGKWWNGVVYETNNELRLKRRELIAIMRSQDGHGGHFDSAIKSETYDFFRGKGVENIQWYFAGEYRVLEALGERSYIGSEWPSAGSKPPSITAGPFPVYLGPQATVRQMAWELDTALLEAGVLSDFGFY